MIRAIVKGHEVLFDEEDRDLFESRAWQIQKHGLGLCLRAAKRRSEDEKRSPAYFHREIMKPPKGMEVDHINRNGLDNRRSNLRVVTSQQNQRNKGVRRDSTTGIKNVSVDRRRGKISFQVQFHGLTLEEATAVAEAGQAILSSIWMTVREKKEAV